MQTEGLFGVTGGVERLVVEGELADQGMAVPLAAVAAVQHVHGITVNAVHPGAILSNLTRHMDQKALDATIATGGYVFKTPEQGAADRLWQASLAVTGSHDG